MSRFKVIPTLPEPNTKQSENGFQCEISTTIRYKLKSNNCAEMESPKITSTMTHVQKKLATRAAWNNLVTKIFKYLASFGDDILLN